jgi:hypothetical protein
VFVRSILTFCGGHAVVQWLRHYAISQKAAGSRPDEVNFFKFASIACYGVAVLLLFFYTYFFLAACCHV